MDRRIKVKWAALLCLLLLSFPSRLFPQDLPFIRLSVKDYDDHSRVIIQSSFPLSSALEKSGSLLLVRFRVSGSFRIQREAFQSRHIESVGWSRGTDNYLLSIKVKASEFGFESFTTTSPPQLVIDLTPKDRETLRESRAEPEKISTSSLEVMKTVVIDPGHGGLENGALGKFGTLEKDITLNISLKLKRIIERYLTFRAVLSREEDLDVSLENRAAIANNNKAFLFISIHANSSFRKEARGPETYFLSLNATDEEARRLAYLENNSEEFEEVIKGASGDDIKLLLWDMAQAAYLKQSSQLAELIQKELNALMETKDRGIKQAPFRVLTGVACPAVLVEVAFLSNSEDEQTLMTEEFQEKIAQAIYRGLLNYLQLVSRG